jgi:hypothetical protein
VVHPGDLTFWLIFLLIFFNIPYLKGAVKLSGYYRTQINIYSTDSLNIGAIDKFRINGALRKPLYSTEFSVDVYSLHGISDLGLSIQPINLNQAFFEFYLPSMTITVGKRMILWGNGLFWNPSDIFNKLLMFDPRREFEGINVLQVRYYIGKLNFIRMILATTTITDKYRALIQTSLNWRNVDLSSYIISNQSLGSKLWGLDAKSEFFNIGWWFEVDRFHVDGNDIWKFVVGFDHTFSWKNGFYVGGEFFFDEGGKSFLNTEEYLRLFSGRQKTLGREYFFGRFYYPFSFQFQGNLLVFSNLSDKGYVISPQFFYVVNDNISLLAGFYYPIGPYGTEFRPDVIALKKSIKSSIRKSELPSNMKNLLRVLDLMGKNVFFVWVEYSF